MRRGGIRIYTLTSCQGHEVALKLTSRYLTLKRPQVLCTKDVQAVLRDRPAAGEGVSQPGGKMPPTRGYQPWGCASPEPRGTATGRHRRSPQLRSGRPDKICCVICKNMHLRTTHTCCKTITGWGLTSWRAALRKATWESWSTTG